MQIFSTIPLRLQSLFESFDPQQPWLIIPKIEEYVRTTVRPGNLGTVLGDVWIDDDVEIGAGAIIEHGAVIKGPTIIGKNCEVRAHAYIRGGVITGDNCVIGHATEVIRSVLMDRVRVDHFNYVGDSLLGAGVHFGAGAKTANLRFDEKGIAIDGIQTGLKKFGAVLGDGCQLGVNVSVGPGIVCEQGCWIVIPYQLPSGRYTKESLKKKRA